MTNMTHQHYAYMYMHYKQLHRANQIQTEVQHKVTK